MQSRTPIPPPRLPPPRAALRDVTARANQSPVTLAPIGKGTIVPPAKSLMDTDGWLKGMIRARDEADALTKALQQSTAAGVGRRAPGPVVYPNPYRQPGSNSLQQSPLAAPIAARAPPASSSRKRKSDVSSDEAIADYKQSLEDMDVSKIPVDLDCNSVRALIRKVVERGIYKKGEFCNTIGCSPTAVNRFLEKTGAAGGYDSDVYGEAWAFFKKRELAGLSMPAASAASQKKAKTAAARSSAVDLNSIHLDGEERDSAPVFETCDVIRRKITVHLNTPGLTQAQFCRDLHAQLNMPGCKSIQSKMLADFRKKKGPRAGCTSSVYYAAYVYFEKKRLAEGKPKSKHRLEMEKIYPQGAERERDSSRGYWAHADDQVVADEYGRITVVRRR